MLGEVLIGHRLITQEQLDHALQLQRRNHEALGVILVRLGYITEDLLLKALAAQCGVAAWHLEKDLPEPDAVARLSATICRKYQVLPVRVRSDLLLVAMRNPHDIDAIDLIRNVTRMRVEPVLANEERLDEAIERVFRSDRSTEGPVRIENLVTQAMGEVDTKDAVRTNRAELAEIDTRPVVGIVNQTISDAIHMGASDIHIEPRANHIEIRFRLDGQLVRMRELPNRLLPMLSARVKIMAEMDIVEHRVPQDGRIEAVIGDRTVDLRVSVLPSLFGSRIVLRVLDRSVSLRPLEELGFDAGNQRLFRSMVDKPYGMILVTGPTGSGKTTTLYAALNVIKSEHTNVMTCEDPVEYQLEGINQSQVNEKVGLTFAAQLRAILRQDPDVVLVGEIRDQETAETAIRASLTGHLVLSTLHCNDAPSAIPRLLDMGTDPFLLSTSLIGVTAQRLVRRLCPACRRQHAPTGEDLALLRHYLGGHDTPILWEATGCNDCSETGFRGRTAVQEILPITPEISKLLASHSPIETIRECAVQYGYRPMQQDVLGRVMAGETSLTEAKRVVFLDAMLGQANASEEPGFLGMAA